MNPTDQPPVHAPRNLLVVLALVFAPAIACSLNPQPFPPENDATGEFDAGSRGQDSAAPGTADAGSNDSADAAAGPSDAGAAVESDGSADGSLETPDAASDGSADGSIDGSDASATDAGPTDASIRD